MTMDQHTGPERSLGEPRPGSALPVKGAVLNEPTHYCFAKRDRPPVEVQRPKGFGDRLLAWFTRGAD